MHIHTHEQETQVLCKFRDKFILILEDNGRFKAAVEPRKLGEPCTDYLSDPRHDVSNPGTSLCVHTSVASMMMSSVMRE